MEDSKTELAPGMIGLQADLRTIDNRFRELIRTKPETWKTKKIAKEFRDQFTSLLDKLADLYDEIEQWIQEKDEEEEE